MKPRKNGVDAVVLPWHCRLIYSAHGTDGLELTEIQQMLRDVSLESVGVLYSVHWYTASPEGDSGNDRTQSIQNCCPFVSSSTQLRKFLQLILRLQMALVEKLSTGIRSTTACHTLATKDLHPALH